MKIYHNPQCSKSNAVLSLVQQSGAEPQVVNYMDDIPTKEELVALLAMLKLRPIELVRTSEPLFRQKFAGFTFSDEQWVDIMLQHPELIERPIVVKDGKAVIARPIERVLELL
ncbi:MAG: arsenate reductase (glutaredoxin) [Armatimonadetes bacterium]|nr:arsenate reductase (glutaredoxin) [Armatimonadota bacterium]